MKKVFPDTMTCEQVQNIWASEPDALGLIDVRGPSAAPAAHLPGSEQATLDTLRAAVNQLEDKLAVVLCAPSQRDDVHARLQGKDNYVILADCERWNEALAARVPEIQVEEVWATRDQLFLIDVRRPEEFNNELGHVEGATLATLGPELTRLLAVTPRDRRIVFICRSGKRSETATLEARRAGFTNVANMVGGMLLWNERNQPVGRTR